MDVDALFREHRPRLLRYVFRLAGDLDVAEDVIQETFVRAMERAPADDSNVRAWLFVIATNLVRDRGKQGERRREIDRQRHSEPKGDRAPATPLEELERRELRGRLLAALDGLGERERIAVVMREEGFVHREIAEALGTTTGTIGTLLARAFNKLARELELDGPAR